MVGGGVQIPARSHLRVAELLIHRVLAAAWRLLEERIDRILLLEPLLNVIFVVLLEQLLLLRRLGHLQPILAPAYPPSDNGSYDER